MRWIANPEIREFESHPVLQNTRCANALEVIKGFNYFKVEQAVCEAGAKQHDAGLTQLVRVSDF